jgi:hypothetical protein
MGKSIGLFYFNKLALIKIDFLWYDVDRIIVHEAESLKRNFC